MGSAWFAHRASLSGEVWVSWGLAPWDQSPLISACIFPAEDIETHICPRALRTLYPFPQVLYDKYKGQYGKGEELLIM